jgi:hypothetical protein
MKKLFVTVAVALTVGLTSFAADIRNVNQKVVAAFEKEFTSATNVSWETIKGADIYHVSFVYANEVMEAYYGFDGDLIAAARHISESKMPLLVSKTLKEKFGKYKMTQASEYMTVEATSYIVTLENDQAKLVVRVYSSGGAEVIKKTKK